MAVNVATLIAELKLDLADFEKKLTQFQQGTTKLDKGFQTVADSGKKAGADLSRVSEGPVKDLIASFQQGAAGSGLLAASFSALSNPITVLGLAIGALAAASLHAMSAITENARSVRDLSAASGLGAEAADDLADTFNLLGFNGDAVSMAMFRMGAEIETGAAGLGRLGIQLRDSAGDLKSEGDLFLEVRDRISQLASASERNAALIDIFGRAGRALAPAFAMSREEFTRWMSEAQKLSPWSDEAQRSSMELVQAQNKLKAAFGGIWEELGLGLAGPAAGFLSWMADVLVKGREFAKLLPQIAVGAMFGPIAGGAVAVAGAETAGAGDVLGPPSPKGGTGGRPTTAEFAATIAVLSRSFQANQQYYARLEGLRQVNVAAETIDRQVALEGMLADLRARTAATQGHFDELRRIAIQQYGEDQAAATAHLADIESQRAAALGQLTSARLGAEAELAAGVTAMRAKMREENIKGEVAMAEEIYANDLLYLKDKEKEGDELSKLREIAKQEDIAAWVAVAQAIEDADFAIGTATAETLEPLRQMYAELERLPALAVLLGPGFDQASTAVSTLTTAMQRLNGVISIEQMDALKTLRDQWTVVVELKGGVRDIIGGMNNAFTDSIKGIVMGTQTLSQAWDNMAQNLMLSVVNVIINQAFKRLADAFDQLLDSMLASAIRAQAAGGGAGGIGGFFGSMLSALFPSGGSIGYGTVGSAIGTAMVPTPGGGFVPALAGGGVVMRPTMALVGESGPEAVVPLGDMARGGGVEIRIIDQRAQGGEISTQESTGADRKRLVEVFIRDAVRQGMARGEYDRAMQDSFGVSRRGATR